MDTNLKLGRKLPELNQHFDLLPQQELQALEMNVLRPRAIVNCVSKEVIEVSANEIATLRRHDKEYAYARGLLCLCVPASLESISTCACAPEMYRDHTSHTSR